MIACPPLSSYSTAIPSFADSDMEPRVVEFPQEEPFHTCASNCEPVSRANIMISFDIGSDTRRIHSQLSALLKLILPGVPQLVPFHTTYVGSASPSQDTAIIFSEFVSYAISKPRALILLIVVVISLKFVHPPVGVYICTFTSPSVESVPIAYSFFPGAARLMTQLI